MFYIPVIDKKFENIYDEYVKNIEVQMQNSSAQQNSKNSIENIQIKVC